jgi:hypothetical protein
MWENARERPIAGTAPREPRVSHSAASLRALAHKCRCLAVGGSMDTVAAALNEMAVDYDRQAERVDKAEARARARLAGSGPA